MKGIIRTKILSMLLILMMLFSMTPVQVFAEMDHSGHNHGDTAEDTNLGGNTGDDNHNSDHEHKEDEEWQTTKLNEAKSKIDALLNKYLGTTTMSKSDVEKSIEKMDDKTLEAAKDELVKLLEFVATLSDAETFFLERYENIETFGYFHDALDKIFNGEIEQHKTVEVLDGKVSLEDTQNTIGNSSGTITATASGYWSSKTNTITITNISETTGTLSFDYEASGNIKTFSETSTTGKKSVLMKPGDNFTISISNTSKILSTTTATLKLSNFSFVEAKLSSNVTFEYDSALGGVTAGGIAITSGTMQEVMIADGVALVATPSSGTTFLGWVDADGKILSTAASYTLFTADDMTVKAAFAKDGGKPWFGVGALSAKKSIVTGSYTLLGFSTNMEQDAYTVAVEYCFDSLEEAAEFAKNSTSSKVIVLMNSGTLPQGEYEIPSGVKLLIPYDKDNTHGDEDPISANIPGSSNKSPTPYRTLTIQDGTTIIVNGSIEVSSMNYLSHGASAIGGRPVQYYGYIVMQGNSKILLNSGAKLFAWGYISGSSEAEVIANSGATIYEKMQVSDYRGGSATSDLTTGRHFPFSQYYIQNVEVKETINYGAQLICHAGIFATIPNEQRVSFMGSSAMFTLKEGSKATKYYDVNTDRLIVDVEGDFSLNSITIMDKNTKDFVLPLQQNLTINLKSGTTTVDQDLMLQPGCTINIAKNATLKIASGKKAYLMDTEQWDTFCSATPSKLVPLTYVPTRNGAPNVRTADNMTDAKLNVNGTLIVEGQIYASASHASVISEGKTGVIQFKSAVSASDSINLYKTNDSSGKVTVAMSPIVLTNGNTVGTKDHPTTNTAGTLASTTYYYNQDCDMWVTHGEKDHAWNEGEETTPPTCTETGIMTYTCSDCGSTKTEVIPARHTEVVDAAVEATCTTAGKTEGKHCSACGEVLVAQTVVDALGHTWAEATCTAPKTCSVCGATEGAALGHTPGAAADCTNAQTCTVCGTELKAALGHTAGAEATCTTAQTCTVCGAELKAALGHTWVEATCTAPKTCSVCGATEG